MVVPAEDVQNGFHIYQRQMIKAFDIRLNAFIRTPFFLMQEWHRRARKTTFAVNLLIREAYRLKNTKYIYVAPTNVMARNIVWDDPQMLRRYLPDKREIGWETNEQKMLVTFQNGSQIKFGGADQPDSLRGIDFIGAVLDEAALMKPEVWSEICRPIIAGGLPPYLQKEKAFRWVDFLYTPKGINYVTQMFDMACCLGEGGRLPQSGIAPTLREDWFVSRLNGELSGILPQAEIKRMQDEVAVGLIPQSYYDQEIKCSRVTSEEMTLITSAMIQNLNDYHEKTTTFNPDPPKRIVAIDPAWGGDVCKLMGVVDNIVVKEKSLKERYNTGDIIMAAKTLAQDIGTKNFIVDTVNDLSIADGLANDEARYNVQYFKSSHTATEKNDTQQAIKYANKRAESYHYTARLIAQKEVGPIKSAELRRQLVAASRYKTQTSSGRMIIIPKLEIKKDLGCSPDEADCYTMAIWGCQNIEAESEEDVHSIEIKSDWIPDRIGV